MIAKVQKNEIVSLILQEKKRLGSASKVANKTAISSATISQMINGNWTLIKDELWLSVGNKLGYKTSQWKLAEISNSQIIKQVLMFAKNESDYVIISAKAGAGKSATTDLFLDTDQSGSVFSIRAREWARRELLINLCRTLGIDQGKGYISVDDLGQKVIRFFIERQAFNPLLIVDEADKLKPSAMRFFIHFYNELEDKAGCVLAGTESLEKMIKRGVRYNVKGYDELDSRFGRNYINVKGASLQDVRGICSLNGITDPSTQKTVFDSSFPIFAQNGGGRMTKVVEDLRRVKRSVKRELMKLKAASQ